MTTKENQPTKPRYRYSIAGLLLLLAIVAAILGIFVNRDNYRAEFIIKFSDGSFTEETLTSDAFVQRVLLHPKAKNLASVKNGTAEGLLKRNLRAVGFMESYGYRIQLTGNSYRHRTAEFNKLLECVAQECTKSHDAIILSIPTGGATPTGR
jgi:hypothetical protein